MKNLQKIIYVLLNKYEHRFVVLVFCTTSYDYAL